MYVPARQVGVDYRKYITGKLQIIFLWSVVVITLFTKGYELCASKIFSKLS
jgi:hypothetical protein